MGWRSQTVVSWTLINFLVLSAGCIGGLRPSSKDTAESLINTTQTTAVSPEAVSSETLDSDALAQAAETPETPDSSSHTESSPSQRDHFREAISRATSAFAIGQTAQSKDDWSLAARHWRQSIQLMEQVPVDSANFETAQIKIQEYQNHLAAAQQRASGSNTPPKADVSQTQADGLVAQIAILERRGGTPVISANMKGQNQIRQFKMLFDTGATVTLITPTMAKSLGVVIVGETTITIADGSRIQVPIGYLDYIEIGGLRKEGVSVVIAGDVGLLGQDFYGEYGISMGSQMINLYK